MALKRVYRFDENAEALKAELAARGRELRELLGGKGAGLMLMTNAGIPVPPGFTITTDTCNEYYAAGRKFPPGLEEEIRQAVADLEAATGKKFGDPNNPLLVSVRSGAKFSMPGMMDTVLNLGMNDGVAEGMVRLTGNPRFVYDAYRRFIMMFGDVVKGVEREKFEHCLAQVKAEEGVHLDTEVSAEGMKKVVEMEKAVYEKEMGQPFPADAQEQLRDAVVAVFESWNNQRAITYRNIHKIPHNLGTAVNVQIMVFGNMGADSGTGVAFTRSPANGEKRIFGEFLINAQGEDVVAGLRTPLPIENMRTGEGLPEEVRPVWARVAEEFNEVAEKLERFFKNMQDIEFTVERGKLWILQTRNGKRTGFAGVTIAVDMVDEGLVTIEQALMQVEPETLQHLLVRVFEEKAEQAARSDPDRFLTSGTGASPGAGAGRVVFTADDAVAWAERGERVVLVRHETSPDDIHGMKSAEAFVTVFGGATSHAAVVGRQMGKPAVVGCGAIRLDYRTRQFEVNGKVVREGDYISADGITGEVFLDDLPTVPSEVERVLEGKMEPERSRIYQYYARFMAWADERRKLGVRTNADTPETARDALIRGAEGIGLCRTEHMFFGPERIRHFQVMILAETPQERAKAAEKLLPYQRKDFEEILEVMDGKPVIIRLLDPPLHEFLPKERADIAEVAKMVHKPQKEIKRIAAQLHELNPMLGHRGCRLGVTFPEIYRMQARAIYEAACALKKRGLNPIPEVMIPLVGITEELEYTKRDVVEVAHEVFQREGVEVPVIVGTMIEVPRACMVAGEIAQIADFFSFGTNDLTQTCFAFSRDDAEGKFIPDYLQKGVLQVSPFIVLDRKGVGRLMDITVREGREANPNLELGICGQHGGDPESIEFCHIVGLDYVSCDPPLVPVARLAAAVAQIKHPR
ncbi:MAG: pyruvate, phosphate dikinase [Armatimonadetes bacterium]|nr:pyruvate, phosphate dikinase [Armatimonadota bacterium]